MSAAIKNVHARRVWDSRGRPTVEAEVTLESGAVGRAIAPAGASRGSREAIDLRDGGERFGGFDVTSAVANVKGEIVNVLVGMDVGDQQAIDDALVALDGTANKGRLGANATVSVSLACLWAAAAEAREPLWAYLAAGKTVTMPLPEIQIFGGGAHAGRRTDIQDFMIMAPLAGSFAGALEITAEVYRHAGLLMDEAGLLAGTADEGGWWPNFTTNEQALEMMVRAIEAAGFAPGSDVVISLDIAASEFASKGGYRFGLEDKEIDRDGLIEILCGWVERYPIASIEDPVHEDDADGMAVFTAAVGDRVQIVGDDFLVTNARRIAEVKDGKCCNAALIKVNQIGTVSEAHAALKAAKDAGWGAIVSARSGESEDLSIAHLSVGWDAGQLKVGSFARSERMAKWNEGLRIEEALGTKAVFAGARGLPAGWRR